MDYLDIKELYHYGIRGQKWGIRRYQNEDGSFTEAGKERYKVDNSGKPTGSGIRKFKTDMHSIKGQQLYEKGRTINGTGTAQGIVNFILGSVAAGTIKTAFKGTDPNRIISMGEYRTRSMLAGIGAVSIASLAALNIKAISDIRNLKAYYANGSHQYHEIQKPKKDTKKDAEKHE